MRYILTSLLLFLVSTSYACCAGPVKDSSIVGAWKGTSICQVKNSPCHDETVVMRVTKLNNKDSFLIKAYKIVNGEEDFMGDIGFIYDVAKHALISMDTARNSVWTFTINGNSIDGTLYVRGVLYRIIKMTK